MKLTLLLVLPKLIMLQLMEIDALKKIALEEPELIHTKDVNGWKPLHEAARSGHVEAVSLLVGYGSDINELTQSGKGVSPLYLAEQENGLDHPVVKFMKSLGTISLKAEL